MIIYDRFWRRRRKIQGTTDELQGLHPNYSDDVYTLLEVHIDLDLEGFEDPNGIMLPYIVTIDENSGQVLSVVRNYREQDQLRRKRQYFVHFKFLPGFGFYGFGFYNNRWFISSATYT